MAQAAKDVGIVVAVPEAESSNGKPGDKATRCGGRIGSDYKISLRAAVILALVSACMTAVAMIVVQEIGSDNSESSGDAGMQASADNVSELIAPSRAELLFAELTAVEVREVARFTTEQLSCATQYSGPCNPAGFKNHTCYITGGEAIALQMPSKAAALAYIDAQAGALPQRFAEVTVVYPLHPVERGVVIYTVGPLDRAGGLSPSATISIKETHHYGRRPQDNGEPLCDNVLRGVLVPLQDLLISSFGPIFPQLDNFKPDQYGRVFPDPSPAGSSTLERRASRVTWHWYPYGKRMELNYVHPVPFSYYVVQVGPEAQWYAENITYCGQVFRTVNETLEAAQNGTLKRCHTKPTTNFTWDVVWQDNQTAANEPSPPTSRGGHATVASHGFNATPGGTVKWGAWELYMTLRPASGLALYDIRWQGKRILYELALSEAQAHYSASDTAHQWYYSDKAFSMTGLGTDMVAGIDCPEDALFLDGAAWIHPAAYDQSVFVSDVSTARPVKLACIFEVRGKTRSLWRHAELAGRVDGRGKRELVVRAISAVSNYDYVSEVRFLEDGSLKVLNEFAGYPENTLAAPFVDPSSTVPGTHDKSPRLDWGNRVRGDLVANLHAHYTVWKVDLDILGTGNDFRVLRATHTNNSGLTRKIEVDAILEKEEVNQSFIASPTSPELWRVVNPSELNALTGEPRGYAIAMQKAHAVQTLPNDHPFTIASAFAKRHVTVTKRKDSEPAVVHVMDSFPMTTPLLSVDNFLSDGESLLNQDLVCWVSMGKEHITRSEDMPVVSNFGVEFSLMPWDYHLQNPAMGF